MPDQRSEIQKRLDNILGMPLYYCADCLRSVDVKVVGGNAPIITRPCDENCGKQIIAPRKAIACGEGGLSMRDKAKTFYWRLAAAMTGRCV